MNFRVFKGVRAALTRVAAGHALGMALAMAVTLVQPAAAKPLELRDLAIAGDSLKTRMLFSLDTEAEPRLMLLRSPHRLVIDLPEARFRFDQKALKPQGLITGIKFGAAGEGMSRIVISAKGPFKIVDFNMLANTDKAGNRLVLDLEAASEQLFDAALAEQATATGSTTHTTPAATPLATSDDDRDSAVAEKKPADRFTVVIDPGHGGMDGGANGLSGTVEKNVTLSFSRELRDLLSKAGDVEVFLTRDDDTFLRLDERVRIAREKGADLFISIHADTIRVKGVSGATVYTVSDQASDAASAALAVRENLSDQLAGIEIKDEDHQVADILVDLIRRETHAFSMGFARTLVDELKQTVTMINNPHRMAGFRVLRAPDVPSVLVELGYLSNEGDEKHLLDPEWRTKAAAGIVDAVLQFAGPRIGSRS